MNQMNWFWCLFLKCKHLTYWYFVIIYENKSMKCLARGLEIKEHFSVFTFKIDLWWFNYYFWIKTFLCVVFTERLSNGPGDLHFEDNVQPKVKVLFVLTLNGRQVRQVRRLLKAIYHQDHFYLLHIDAVGCLALGYLSCSVLIRSCKWMLFPDFDLAHEFLKLMECATLYWNFYTYFRDRNIFIESYFPWKNYCPMSN